MLGWDHQGELQCEEAAIRGKVKDRAVEGGCLSEMEEQIFTGDEKMAELRGQGIGGFICQVTEVTKNGNRRDAWVVQ